MSQQPKYTREQLEALSTEELLRILTHLRDVTSLMAKANRETVIKRILNLKES